MKIAVVDYKAGNLRNVQKAVESLGVESDIISEPQDMTSYSGIILPGVGNFSNGIESLNDSGLDKTIVSEAQDFKKPLLGICLGMQLLAESSEEGGVKKGLGLLPMTIKHFDIQNKQERVPHMGWNSISPDKGSILLKNVPFDSDFYFAHSYHAVLNDKSIIAATCEYAYSFPAAVEYKNIFAAQFHPEKSQRYGSIVLKNFLSYCA